MRRLLLFLTIPALAVGLHACADRADDAGPAGPETVRSEAPAGCDLRVAQAAARDYFLNNTRRRAAQDALRQISKDCTNSSAYQAVASGAWGVLALMEAALEAGTTGSAAVGEILGNAMIDCIEDTGFEFCQPTGAPFALQAALSPTGSFGVRIGGTMPVVARDEIPFEYEGEPNSALWGMYIAEGSNWAAGTNAPEILIYGSPTDGAPDPGQVALFDEALRYDFESFPVDTREGRDFDGSVLIGVCFDTPIHPMHEPGEPSPIATIERRSEGLVVLLERPEDEPPFCDEQVAAADVGGPLGVVRSALAAAGRALLPSRLVAAVFSDLMVPVIAAGPGDLSTFSAVAADVNATLQVDVFLPGAEEPVPLAGLTFDDAVVGEVIADAIVVTARSGDGVLMEKVKVTGSIDANQGVPAGGTFVDENGNPVTPMDLTAEETGQATLGPIRLGKAGGYVLCVSGEYEPFIFPVICSEGSHIDNDTGMGGG